MDPLPHMYTIEKETKLVHVHVHVHERERHKTSIYNVNAHIKNRMMN